jgi:hypothetical protein
LFKYERNSLIKWNKWFNYVPNRKPKNEKKPQKIISYIIIAALESYEIGTKKKEKKKEELLFSCAAKIIIIWTRKSF